MPTTKIHKLKCWPPFFEETWRGRKTFEIRRNDRIYQVGDILELFEFEPAHDGFGGGRYTMRMLRARVEFTMTHGEFPGVAEGFIAMGLFKFLAYDTASPDDLP